MTNKTPPIRRAMAQKQTGLKFSQELADTVLPMHLVLSKEGKILHLGPALLKIFSETKIVGADFFKIFRFSRPSFVSGTKDLRAAGGTPLHVSFREIPELTFKGLAVEDKPRNLFLCHCD